MRRKSAIWLGFGVAVTGALGCVTATHAAITIDGTLDGDYGAPLATGHTATSLGDSTGNNTVQYSAGSEIDATYAKVQNDTGGTPTLYVFLAGNLANSNSAKLNLFIQTGTGGTNVLTQLNGGASPGGYNRLTGPSTGPTNRGLQFNTGFAPNYYFVVQPSGESPTNSTGPNGTDNTSTNIYVDNANLTTKTAGAGADFNPGTLRTVYGSSTYQSLKLSLNNSNTGGVTATDGTNASSPAGVTTGVEFAISLADITEAGQSISSISLTALLTNADSSIVSNQITNLPDPYVYNDTSVGTTQNLGDPTYSGSTNFNNQSAPLFVTIAVPEPASLGLFALGAAAALRRRTRVA